MKIKHYSLEDWLDGHEDLEKGFVKVGYDPNFMFLRKMISDETRQKIIALQDEGYQKSLEMSIAFFKESYTNQIVQVPDDNKKLYHQLEIDQTTNRLREDISSWQSALLNRRGYVGIDGIQYKRIKLAYDSGHSYSNRLSYMMGEQPKLNGTYNASLDFQYLQWLKSITTTIDRITPEPPSRNWDECTMKTLFLDEKKFTVNAEILYKKYKKAKPKQIAGLLISLSNQGLRLLKKDIIYDWGEKEASMVSDFIGSKITRQAIDYHFGKYKNDDPDTITDVKIEEIQINTIFK